MSAPACVTHPGLYLDALAQPDASPGALADGRAMCNRCPLFVRCLSDALSGPESEGFIAGTTADERSALQRVLHLTNRTVHTDDYLPDELEDRVASRDVVDHRHLATLLRRNPGSDLAEIARQAGCSVGTVKRHQRNPQKAIAAWDATKRKQGTAPTESDLRGAYGDLLAGDVRVIRKRAEKTPAPAEQSNKYGQLMLPVPAGVGCTTSRRTQNVHSSTRHETHLETIDQHDQYELPITA